MTRGTANGGGTGDTTWIQQTLEKLMRELLYLLFTPEKEFQNFFDTNYPNSIPPPPTDLFVPVIFLNMKLFNFDSFLFNIIRNRN